MATKKISELTTGSTLDGTETFPVVQGTSTVKILISAINAYLASVNATLPSQTGASGKFLTSNGTSASFDFTPYDLIIACSDLSTSLTTGTNKAVFRTPRAMTITSVKASLATAGTGTVTTFDINKNGTSILSTKLTVDASEKTSGTAATAAVISTTSLSADDEITIDFDTVGTGAKGAVVYIVGKLA